MTDHPIIFSAPMIRALLAGRKTMTRRVLSRLRGKGVITQFGPSDTSGYDWHFRDRAARWHDVGDARLFELLPFAVGDRLWVRESVTAEQRPLTCVDGVQYIADGRWEPIDNTQNAADRWIELFNYRRRRGATIPPIHMPRWASRLTLIIQAVKVEPLRNISEADAVREGVYATRADADDDRKPTQLFQALWGALHGSAGPGSWDANPWVIAIAFRVIEANIEALS